MDILESSSTLGFPSPPTFRLLLLLSFVFNETETVRNVRRGNGGGKVGELLWE